jgi:hypothetical protein
MNYYTRDFGPGVVKVIEPTELETLIATQSDGGTRLLSEQLVPITSQLVRENPHTLWCNMPELS